MDAAETRAFMQARRRFLKRPSAKHLRELRDAARRLRSLLADFRDLFPRRKRRALRRLIALTGEARDAAALRKTLRDAFDPRERPAARVLLRELRAQEKQSFRRVRGALVRLRYAT
jgi:CHAD domain-containing protein